jgi:hypothetical protein
MGAKPHSTSAAASPLAGATESPRGWGWYAMASQWEQCYTAYSNAIAYMENQLAKIYTSLTELSSDFVTLWDIGILNCCG